MSRTIAYIFLAVLCAASCRPPVYPPKPQGYFKLDTPAHHEYRLFSHEGFPYTFEYPLYSTITDDTVYRMKGANNAYWINIFFPGFNGVINITYKEITEAHPYIRMVIESDSLSSFHMTRADNIEPFLFSFPEHRVSGILYTVLGNAATRYQFTATDSVKHFMRGALYFNVTPNADSLKPATDFLEKDIKHLLETITWR